MSAAENDNVFDDNKLDFELLTRRRRQSRQSRDSSSSDARTSPKELADNNSTSASSAVASDPESDLVWPLILTPTFVDHYVTGEVIGSGSYADVRECVDTRTLERFAMKIINKAALSRQAPQALENQLREIRLLRHFDHTNIIGMKECLIRAGFVYIILEYCPFNLDQLLCDQVDGKIHVALARRLFHQLCSAVGYLHSLGVAHRDIKPQNMLLTNCGHLKLIDFGVSHVLSIWDRSDLCNNYEGSPLFQAPEIVVGGLEYNGFKADVWSCGVTLFLVLYGKYPFIDDALLGLYDKILGAELVVPDCAPTSKALADLLVFMLDKDWSRRACIEEVLGHPWLKLIGAANECDELEHLEFFDLVIKRHNDQRKLSQIHATSQQNDMYKSMTVLPYLYKHHFPQLPIKKHQRASGPPEIITRIHSLDGSSTTSGRASPAGPNQSSSDTDKTASPHDILDDDQQQPEWGTRAQYHLLKVPQVRANRIRCGAASRFQGRRRRKRKSRMPT